jgi:outer membrane murein-binding lipoprotein Lpp
MPNQNQREREREERAREKARELLQGVGGNLSAQEAQKIAKKADIPIQQVVRIAERQDVNIQPRAQERISAAVEAAKTPPPSAQPQPQPKPTNELTNFRGSGGGFGINAYQYAINAGYAPEQIATLLPGSGLSVGEKAQTQLGTDLATLRTQAEQSTSLAGERDYWAGQANRAKEEADSYFSELEGYSSRFDQLTSQYSQALSQQQSVKAEADAAKQRADELEKQRRDEQEIQVSQQLNSLRGGYTASGSGSTGLGSLSSGSTTRSISTGAKSGSILDRAYQDIDPTDSVLNKDVAASSVAELRGGRRARSEARQRALASGQNASSYYSRRFG